MLRQTLFIVCLAVFVRSGEVYKKLCADVGSSQCAVHSVTVDPCPHGPRFCTFIADKRYSAKVDFTPYFSAHNLTVSVTGLLEDLVSFEGRTYKDACRRLLTCPLEGHIRQSFEIPLAFDKLMLGSQGKFPVQVKLWNADDASEACCFTFRAKMR